MSVKKEPSGRRFQGKEKALGRPGFIPGAVAAAGLAVAVLVAAVCLGAPPAAKERPFEIAWTDFQSGMKLAEKDGKPSMIYFTAVWCGWCKKLEKEAFRVPEVIELSRQFVCIKVDGDKQPTLLDRYEVDEYPTVVFSTSKGKEVLRIPDYVPAEEFLAKIKTALVKTGVDKPTGKEK
jgi:thioredoxin-related protein